MCWARRSRSISGCPSSTAPIKARQEEKKGRVRIENLLEVGEKRYKSRVLHKSYILPRPHHWQGIHINLRIRSTLIKAATKPRQPTYRIHPFHVRERPLKETREPPARSANPRHTQEIPWRTCPPGRIREKRPSRAQTICVLRPITTKPQVLFSLES